MSNLITSNETRKLQKDYDKHVMQKLGQQFLKLLLGLT